MFVSLLILEIQEPLCHVMGGNFLLIFLRITSQMIKMSTKESQQQVEKFTSNLPFNKL